MPDFSAFFQALWQPYEPFPWQAMLAERIVDGRWPAALDLPTAAGKTACIDAAVYALAWQADRAVAIRTAPRRIWFVVDRRIVVDEAFDRASTIARKLSEATEGPLKEVADRLRQISGTERPLATARLRGGILRDDGWARLPSQPAVITSTVDQLGSRLLFRGYGRSHLAAPIFAGLAAHDSLILLDEAHCSVPFLQTLRGVETYRGNAWAESPIETPFAFVILSATPPPDIPEDAVFPGSDRDRALDHPVLHTRLSASKPAELVTIKTRANEDDPLVIEAAERAWSYVKEHDKQRVAVIVNRVRTAEEITRILREQSNEEVDVVLLTGCLRPFERDRLVERWKPVLKAASPEKPERPVLLVSTQCIEVGADFSFDALVTEAASLDALRQRFGRLNRMGLPGAAPAAILIRDLDTQTGDPDPIYGTAISECWRLLTEKAICAKEGKEERRSIDFGVKALDASLADVEDLSPFLAPTPDAPALLPAHLDLLCQTAPTPCPEPSIHLFLHGKDRGAPEVRVVWRADLPAAATGTWRETVALCPPGSGEMLSAPLYRLRAWLAMPNTVEEAGDVEGAAFVDEDSAGEVRPVLLWRGRDRSALCRRVSDILPNDIVILPAEYGISGLGQSEPAEALGKQALDLWEPTRASAGRPRALRLHRVVLAPWLGCPRLNELVDLAEAPAWERASLQEAIDAVLEYGPASDDQPPALPAWLLDLLRAVRNGRFEDHPAGGVIVFARDQGCGRTGEPDLFADDDDLMSASGEAVPLARHTASVERAVQKIASRCLPDQFLDPLQLAAYWHDVGKLDERFQIMLHQGDELAAVSGEPLAKSVSVPASPARRRAIREASGLPPDFRHEMLSFQLAKQYVELPDRKETADLFLHLVASHHGHARPFAPVSPDTEPPAISGCHDGAVIELAAAERAQLPPPHRVDSGLSERFWRLTRRYGWWGLAYLEAILRLGDWYGSHWVLDEAQVKKPTQPARSHRAACVAVRVADDPWELTGLDGANPLGFLAALGTLVVLRQEACPELRLSWKRSVTWQPVLTGVSCADQETLCECMANALRGNPVSNAAEGQRQAAQAEFDAAKKTVKDKRAEIKERRLRGKERKAAIEAEVAPLEQEARNKRSVWLAALKGAVPRRELAIGKHIDCTGDEYREYVTGFLENGGIAGREPLDLLAAFASDACLEKSGRVAATPFCFITGSGHQYFLDTVRQLMEVVNAKRVRSVLFGPWTYTDEKLSMRWDPMEDRRYALMDRDPTATDNKSRTVWMANLLAYRALALFPSASSGRGLETTAWSRSGEIFTWPIWEHPADPDTIRSLMLLPDLGTPAADRSALRARGIVAAFRARRIQVGKPPLDKVNFSPSRGI